MRRAGRRAEAEPSDFFLQRHARVGGSADAADQPSDAVHRQEPQQWCHPGSDLGSAISRIAGEDSATAVARERDGDVLANLARQPVCGERARIGELAVEMMHHLPEGGFDVGVVGQVDDDVRADASAATTAAKAVSSWLCSAKRTVKTGVVTLRGRDSVSKVELMPPDCSTPIGTSLMSCSSTTRGRNSTPLASRRQRRSGPVGETGARMSSCDRGRGRSSGRCRAAPAGRRPTGSRSAPDGRARAVYAGVADRELRTRPGQRARPWLRCRIATRRRPSAHRAASPRSRRAPARGFAPADPRARWRRCLRADRTAPFPRPDIRPG